MVARQSIVSKDLNGLYRRFVRVLSEWLALDVRLPQRLTTTIVCSEVGGFVFPSISNDKTQREPVCDRPEIFGQIKKLGIAALHRRLFWRLTIRAITFKWAANEVIAFVLR